MADVQRIEVDAEAADEARANRDAEKAEGKPKAEAAPATEKPEDVQPEKVEGEESKPEAEAKGDDESLEIKKTDTPAEVDFSAFAQEFSDTGNLSDESRAKVKEALPGVTDGLIDTYLNGLKAINDQATNDGFSLVGGQDQYAAMSQWAAKSLTDAELAEYNAAVTGNTTPDRRAMAVKGLFARFRAEGGAEPDLSHRGQGANVASGSLIRSRDEHMELIRDKRYRTSETFRNDVIARLARSIEAGVYQE